MTLLAESKTKSYFGFKSGGGKLPPTRNLREFAKEIGITHKELVTYSRNDPGFPEPRIRAIHQRTSDTYFSHSDLLRWWKARQAKK